MQLDGIFRTSEGLAKHLEKLPEGKKIVVFRDASSLKFPCEVKEVNDYAVEMLFPNRMRICVELCDIGLDKPYRLKQHLEVATQADIVAYLAASA